MWSELSVIGLAGSWLTGGGGWLVGPFVFFLDSYHASVTMTAMLCVLIRLPFS